VALTWDERLISRAEAAALAGAHPVAWYLHDEDPGLLVLRCRPCGQSCGLWAADQPTSVDDFIAAVLRHLVMAHDVPLNRAARERMMTGERDNRGTAGSGEAGAGHARAADDGAAAGGGGGGVAADRGGGGADDRDTPDTGAV
jgi:hypothetical protein